MKRIVGISVLVITLLLPATNFAAEDQIGVYVAPKLALALVLMSDVQLAGNGTMPGGTWNARTSGSTAETSFGGALAVGYDFSKRFDIPVRAELEYFLLSNVTAKADKTPDGATAAVKQQQDYQISTLLVNAYYDIHLNSRFTPYVGLGLGMGFIETKWTGSDKWGNSGNGAPTTVNNVIWGIGGGVGFAVNDTMTVDAGYRLVSLGSVKTKNYSGMDISGGGRTGSLFVNEFMLGLRFTF